MCVCVGLAHLVFSGKEREQVCENVEWVKLFCVCLCLYVSKLVGKQYLHGSGFLIFFLSFLGVWDFLFLVCVCVCVCVRVVFSPLC